MFGKRIFKLVTQNLLASKPLRFFTSLESNPYSLPGNSIKKQIYVFRQDEGYLGYIIKDEATHSLICVDPGKFDVAINLVRMMEDRMNAKLSYIMCTHNFHMTSDVEKFMAHNKKLEIIVGKNGSNHGFHNKQINDEEPLKIGDLEFKFIHSPGCTSDAHFISLNENILFTGETVLLNTLGNVTNSKEMASTVNKLTKYPEETAIFPSKDINIDDIEFAKSIDPSSTAINVRLHFAKQAHDKKITYAPTCLYEERKCNIFLRTNDRFINYALQENKPYKMIESLIELRKNFVKPAEPVQPEKPEQLVADEPKPEEPPMTIQL